MMIKVDPAFIDRIPESFDARACMNCGNCTALCPMEIEILPRSLFRYVMLGIGEKVLLSETEIYSCLLCRMCEANCPSEVPIAENIRLLRGYINENVHGLR